MLRVAHWKLGDFGVSSAVQGSYSVAPGATLDYTPPELSTEPEGFRVHRSADVWALGVTLWMVARRPAPRPPGPGRHQGPIGFEPARPGPAQLAAQPTDLADPAPPLLSNWHPTRQLRPEAPPTPVGHPAPVGASAWGPPGPAPVRPPAWVAAPGMVGPRHRPPSGRRAQARSEAADRAQELAGQHTQLRDEYYRVFNQTYGR